MDQEHHQNMTDALKRIANAITPPLVGAMDETGGHVESLTEAVMGLTRGACRIADAIESLADAVRASEQRPDERDALEQLYAEAMAETERIRDEIRRTGQ